MGLFPEIPENSPKKATPFNNTSLISYTPPFIAEAIRRNNSY